jgi:AcrR family transcriptional regulator
VRYTTFTEVVYRVQLCYCLWMANAEPAPHPPASLRADQVVAATRALFLRYGYRRTTVDDIAREAGVAKATLYLHFAGKEDMFRAMILRFRDSVNAGCDAAEQLDAPVGVRLTELLYANYGTALEWFGEAAHLNELKMFVSEHPIGLADDAAPAFPDRLKRMLSEAIERGEIARQDDPGYVADVAQTLMFAAVGAKRTQKNGAAGMRPALAMIVGIVLGGVRN